MSKVSVESSSAQALDSREVVKDSLAKAAHYLPGQPPLHAFVHHNTLHAFEHYEFDTALAKASALYGTEPYQSEQAFAAHIESGRIDSRDIEAILERENIGDSRLWPKGPKKIDFWRLRLASPFDVPSVETVRWMLSEGELFEDLHRSLGHNARDRWLSRLNRSDPGCSRSVGLSKLWHSLVDLAPKRRATQVGPRLRDFVFSKTSEDIDEWTRPLLIRLAGAYLDQGVSVIEMPNRGAGFLASVRALYASSPWISKRWMSQFFDVLRDHSRQNYDAIDTIIWALETSLIPHDQWNEYIVKSLLVLKGWAGMFYQYETRSDRLPVRPIPAKVADFLAVQLTLEVVAIRHAEKATKAFTFETLTQEQAPAAASARDLGVIFEAFVSAQELGLVYQDLSTREHAQRLVDEVVELDDITRRRLLHRAYEHHYRVRTMDALLVAQEHHSFSVAEPALQAVFCMDEREESLRRHLEEQSAAVETYGYAGFFGVAMSYRGMDDVKARPLCPVVVTPTHLVEELPVDENAVAEYQRKKKRRGQTTNFVRVARDDALRGGFWSLLVGALKIVPLIGWSLFPRAFSRVTHRLHELGIERPNTRLRIESNGDTDPTTGLTLGYTIAEMTAIVENMLSTMGLSHRFAPIVLVVGHGSSSLNNPHEAAHDCGATGGGRGGPNARAFAMMANHPEVRVALAKYHSIHINDKTWFVGGYHNTCDDSMTYYDLDLLPKTHGIALENCKSLMVQACVRDAHERCRRFESAPIDLTLPDALAHAEEHASDLGQPRPEYGHATNAVCVIGRRRSTRNLFLDRRAFLISYDPDDDKDGEAIGALLAAAGPVGAGISLEYYFSFIDPNGYGCGTKLPHNISGLIGVMDGHSSDLRTGLPWQMVEIHEPMRLLVVVEATPAALERVVETRPGVAQLVLNHWIQLVSMDPQTGAAHEFVGDRFVPYTPFTRDLPTVESSVDHYAGHREHLECGIIYKDAEYVA